MALAVLEPEDALLSVWHLIGYGHLAPALLVGSENASRLDLFISVSYQTLVLCYGEHLPWIREGWGTLASRQLSLEGLSKWTNSPSGCLKRKYGKDGLCQRFMSFHERVVASILGVSLVDIDIISQGDCLDLNNEAYSMDKIMLGDYFWHRKTTLIRRTYSKTLSPNSLTRALLARNQKALSAFLQTPASHVTILPEDIG